jgi:hypothetical protein
MALESPRPGQVINYRYRWWSEQRRDVDQKPERHPCALVLAVRGGEGRTRVYVLPITHTAPNAGETAVEILPDWKPNMRLDDQQAWIIASELNHFEWPGPDVIGSDTAAIVRGLVPYKVVRRLRSMILSQIRDKTLRATTLDLDGDLADSAPPAPAA